MQVIFETPRLLLRQFTEADATLILGLNSDPVVLKYLHEPLLQDEEHAKSILVNIIFPQYQHNLGRWAMITREDNEFIGWCGLKYRPELDEIDLGYRLMQKAWGRGFATEAARHTLDHGFKNLDIPVITGRAHIENTASIRVLEKIGMNYINDGIVDDCPVRTYTLANPTHP
jgi:[ribosomal protein S5]-alanine N-acetyltransferase